MKNTLRNRATLFVAGICTLFIFIVTVSAWSEKHEHGGDHKHAVSDKMEKKEIKFLFGNHQCPVTGETVVPESFVEAKHEEKKLVGRIYTCCEGCNKKVKKNFADLYKKFYRTDPKTGKEKEPEDLKNATCPMSGETVTANDWIEYNGKIVHFCCEGCVEEFLEEPNSHLAKMVEDPKDYAYKRPPGSGSSKH